MQCVVHTAIGPPRPDPPRSERDRLYERAEKVGALLANLGEQLKEAIADVNDSTGGWGPREGRRMALLHAAGCGRRQGGGGG